MNLVTGAGGSIGSEICKQADCIAVGHGENSLYKLQASIKIVADVRDYDRMEEIIIKYKPTAIFHAAAHKHVQFGESNVNDFISNNVIGTQNMVRLARKHGIDRFVLVSTDKAVEPISTMGITKRLAELVVLDAGYTVVRLGNVAWSRGSVLPFWKKQIETGLLTITHPEVRRYFIQKERAAKFILEVFGNNIWIPVMNEYRMIDIAKAMIRGRDVKVKVIGLQPGEKMREKLFCDYEKPMKLGDRWILR